MPDERFPQISLLRQPKCQNGTFRFTVDPGRRLVISKFGKNITAEQIADYASSLRANPVFSPAFAEIADLSEVESLNLQADEFLRLADEIDPFSLESKRAFVVRTATQAHAARLHKILRAQRHFGIFSSMEQAEKWIAKELTPERKQTLHKTVY